MAAPLPSLSLALGAPGTRLAVGARRAHHALAAATAALALTLMLGALPLLHALASWPPALLVLGFATCAGLLFWHLARLTAMPPARGGLAAAALPAALLPVALIPRLSLVALLPGLALGLAAARRDPVQRVVALLIHCGAVPLLASIFSTSQLGHAVGYAILLAGTALATHQAVRGGANDNPLLEPSSAKSWLLAASRHARERRDSGKWDLSHVQPQSRH